MKVYIIFLKKNLMQNIKNKDEIRKRFVSLSIKPKCIFNEVSQEMRFKCSEYNTIKYQMTRNINK